MDGMGKRILCGLLLLLLCGCGAAGEHRHTEAAAALSQPAKADAWANVRDYGAVGDAVYHHHLGKQINPYSFWAGHFSELSTAEYHIPYRGKEPSSLTYQVVPDRNAPSNRQICLSDVNPGYEAYKPAPGDTIVKYTAADLSASVPATDDSAAFERAIAAGDGLLYLPEGDYLISQLTAAKIKDLQGPGTIWLKEWRGAELYYLTQGSSDVLIYKNYGWINAARFHNDAWRDMHWITCFPQVYGWKSSEEFTGNFTPRSEFGFNKNRVDLNIWLTIQPAVAEKDFPDAVTVCISDASSNYTERGKRTWHRASGSGMGGGFFSLAWDGSATEFPDSALKDCGDHVEVTVRREDLFHHDKNGKTENWALHCWNLESRDLSGIPVEYACNTAKVWVKEANADGLLMCDIGGDMRTSWKNRSVREGYIQEACDSGTQLLTVNPRRFYAYTVPDSVFVLYSPFPK